MFPLNFVTLNSFSLWHTPFFLFFSFFTSYLNVAHGTLAVVTWHEHFFPSHMQKQKEGKCVRGASYRADKQSQQECVNVDWKGDKTRLRVTRANPLTAQEAWIIRDEWGKKNISSCARHGEKTDRPSKWEKKNKNPLKTHISLICGQALKKRHSVVEPSTCKISDQYKITAS